MPIVVSENAALKLHRIQFDGRITHNELCGLSAFHQRQPRAAAADTAHFIAANADLSEITNELLDGMRRHYRVLHTSIDFFLLRRVAWVCESHEARGVVSYWMKGRHSRDGQGSELLLVRNIREVGDLFSEDEINSLEAANEFAEMLRLDDGERVSARAAAR